MARPLDLLRNDAWELLDGFVSDQEKGVPPPPLQTTPPGVTPDIMLPSRDGLGSMQLRDAMERRRSRRKYSEAPLSAAELSFLLWATQGIQKVFREGMAAFRTVPSGGARHPFETVLVARNIAGVGPGRYRYMPLQHGLRLEGPAPSREEVSAACAGQDFVASAPVVFIWTAVPYRTEWRYGPAAAKLIALDAGHLCQNLYLAAEALGLGTCAIGAYIQDAADRLAGVDGSTEAVVYMAPVGR